MEAALACSKAPVLVLLAAPTPSSSSAFSSSLSSSAIPRSRGAEHGHRRPSFSVELRRGGGVGKSQVKDAAAPPGGGKFTMIHVSASLSPPISSSSTNLRARGAEYGGQQRPLLSMEELRKGGVAPPLCGKMMMIRSSASLPLPISSSSTILRGRGAEYGGQRRPLLSVELRRGGRRRVEDGAALLCGKRLMVMMIQSSPSLRSGAGEQGRRRRSTRWSAFDENLAVVYRRSDGILRREGKEDSLMSSTGSAARLTGNLGQLPVARRGRRVLKKAVNLTLRVLQGSRGRLSWPLLPFPGFGAGGESSTELPQVNEQGLFYQWYPILKRRGLAFFISSAMIAMLVVSGPTNYALQPAWSLTEENLVFLEAWRIVDRAYVDKSFNGQSWFRYREDALKREPMMTRSQTYDAIRKMLATLDDPFTRFLEPEKFKALKSGTNGALIGVGLEVGFDVSLGGTSEDLVVVSPVLGGPAGRAGIVPGDVILAIDGVSTKGMGLYDAARRLQGPLNSPVNLTVLNKNISMPKTVTVLREKVTLNPVSWKLCDVSNADQGPTKLGYIRLSTFNQNSSRAVKTAIENLRESGATAFVLDIRNNSGGLFPAGVEIAKMWLDRGVIVYITDSKGVRDIYETDGVGAIATTEPLTVLVNKGTASASEILAGALKDNNRAVIVGETTFGKGRIQSIFQLSDGSGLAVTVARYETPAHINIDKVGITPDHPLPAGVLPMEEESFCKFLRDPSNTAEIPKIFSIAFRP
ncbi:unnamed protein product [Calypogeia fissa]